MMLFLFHFTRRTIQESAAGHDSIEDALASLDLAKLKIEKGDSLKAYGGGDNIYDRRKGKERSVTICNFSVHAYTSRFLWLVMYTAKLLFHQSPTRHSDYTVTTTVTM